MADAGLDPPIKFDIPTKEDGKLVIHKMDRRYNIAIQYQNHRYLVTFQKFGPIFKYIDDMLSKKRIMEFDDSVEMPIIDELEYNPMELIKYVYRNKAYTHTIHFCSKLMPDGQYNTQEGKDTKIKYKCVPSKNIMDNIDTIKLICKWCANKKYTNNFWAYFLNTCKQDNLFACMVSSQFDKFLEELNGTPIDLDFKNYLVVLYRQFVKNVFDNVPMSNPQFYCNNSNDLEKYVKENAVYEEWVEHYTIYPVALNPSGDVDAYLQNHWHNSTTQGMLPPRMNTTQQNTILTPATGLTSTNHISLGYQLLARHGLGDLWMGHTRNTSANTYIPRAVNTIPSGTYTATELQNTARISNENTEPVGNSNLLIGSNSMAPISEGNSNSLLGIDSGLRDTEPDGSVNYSQPATNAGVDSLLSSMGSDYYSLINPYWNGRNDSNGSNWAMSSSNNLAERYKRESERCCKPKSKARRPKSKARKRKSKERDKKRK
jgi:hypothetical protein